MSCFFLLFFLSPGRFDVFGLVVLVVHVVDFWVVVRLMGLMGEVAVANDVVILVADDGQGIAASGGVIGRHSDGCS